MKRKGKSTPLILFSADFIEGIEFKGYAGCANKETACGQDDGSSFGIVTMRWRNLNIAGRIQQMARTVAHEFGHMVNFPQIFPFIF